MSGPRWSSAGWIWEATFCPTSWLKPRSHQNSIRSWNQTLKSMSKKESEAVAVAVSRLDLQFLQSDFVQVFGEELGFFKMTHGWNSYKQLANSLTQLERFLRANIISQWFKVSKCYMSTASFGQKIHRFPHHPFRKSTFLRDPPWSTTSSAEVGHHQDPLGISAGTALFRAVVIPSDRWGNGGRLWIAGLWRGDLGGIPLSWGDTPI